MSLSVKGLDSLANRHSVDVTLAPALVRLFPDAEPRLAVCAGSVRDVIDALNVRWPGMRDRICDETPAVRRHINVYVDGRKASLETPVKDGAKVLIMTAVSGG